MKNGVDYKSKYLELKDRFIKAMDGAYRMGYQQGAAAKQMEMMQMQQQQAAQAGQPGQGAPQPVGPDQSELDQYIQELESIVNKSEEVKLEELKKSVDKIKTFQLQKKMADDLKKTIEKPKSISYKVNMDNDSKMALSQQEKIVSDIMNKWEKESQNAMSEMSQILGVEGLLSKKE